jgi:hypothetical protein
VCAIEYLQQAADAFQKNNPDAVVMAEVCLVSMAT